MFGGHRIEEVSTKGWTCSCGVQGRQDNETAISMAIAEHLESILV